MTDTYERGFRKVAQIHELPSGEPKLFRTGGSVILLLRGSDIRAADATACDGIESGRMPRERLAAVSECLGGQQSAPDWNEVVRQKPLPVEVRGEDVWVCLELCASD